MALAVLGDRELAEEAVQDAFVAAWRYLGVYDASQGAFSAWITHIAHNKVVDLLRRRRRLYAHQADVEVENILAMVPDPTPGPERQSEVHLLGERVRRALADLPPAQREVLTLAYFSGYTHEEIARQIGRPLGTVKTWIRVGLETLRAAWRET